MKQFVKVNLNNYIKFKPTTAAHTIQHQYYLNLGLNPNNHDNLKLDSEGCCKMQMWEFMQIFGKHFVMGFGEKQPIEDMNVYVEVE